MTKFDWLYLVALCMLVGGEITAILSKADHGEGQTISHKIVRWIKVNPGKRRIVILIALAWFAYHLLWQPF